MRRALLFVLSLLLLVSTGPASPAHASQAPPESTWKADVQRVMQPAPAYLRRQAARAGSGDRLAINLDIDNTSLATYYEQGHAVVPVLRAAQLAHRLGMAVLFNTARSHRNAALAVPSLRRAGYPVDAICSRNTGETVQHSKQRCRAQFVAAGYTILANVGNSRTDFVGSDYRRAFRLPNYGGAFS